MPESEEKRNRKIKRLLKTLVDPKEAFLEAIDNLETITEAQEDRIQELSEKQELTNEEVAELITLIKGGEFKGEKGKDGKDGKDGYTPIKGIDYFDGKDGIDGVDGKDGKDAVLPDFTPILHPLIEDGIKKIEGGLKLPGGGLGGSSGFYLHTNGTKKGRVNNLNFVEGTGVTLAHSKVNGLDRLTVSADLTDLDDTFVPYTGATAEVDLGGFGLTANALTATGGDVEILDGGGLVFYTSAGAVREGSINSQGVGLYAFQATSGFLAGTLDFSGISSTAKTFTLPNSTGSVIVTPSIQALNFTSALYNSTFISLADSAGSPNAYTMHVGGGDTGGGLGDFNEFIIEMTASGYTSTTNTVNLSNVEGFFITSGSTGSSFNIQEQNQSSTPNWVFASDQSLNFNTSAGTMAFSSTGVGDGVAVAVTCTSTGGVGTCTTVSGNHNLATGDFVLIAGANEAGYNGYVSIHRTSATAFTYPVAASTASPATGTITATDMGTGVIQLGSSTISTPATQDISIPSTGGVSLFRTDGNGFSTTGASSLSTAPGSVFFGTLETTAPASLTEPLAFFNILTPTMTGRIAQTTFQARIDNSGTTSITIPTGTSANIGGLWIDAPRFIMTGSSTTSSSLYITGAPTKTSGAGTLGSPYALFVDADTSRFDGALELTAKAGTTTDGHLWNDSTQKALQTYVDGVEQTISGALFTQTASATVANTVTETALSSTGVGTLTLPANFLLAGKKIRVTGWGFHSSTGNPTITVRIKLGSTTVCTMTGTSGNGSNDTFVLRGEIICRTTGASGTVFGQGLFEEVHGSGLRTGADNTATTTIDTTASQAVSVTAQWGTADAGNTITCTNLSLEVLN